MNATTLPLADFSTVLSRAWIWGRRLLLAFAAVIVGLVLLEFVRLHGDLSSVHPALAWTVSSLIVVASALTIGWALVRYFRLPRALNPPDLPPVEQGWSREQRETYRRFALRFLERQRANPNLDAEARQRAVEAMDKVRAVEIHTTGDLVATTGEFHLRITLEIDHVLAPLDERANRLIRRAAVEVALATAVSPSILLDSMITLSRNLDLMAKIATLYYGRPSLPVTLKLARDVIGSAVAAGALEVITDNVSGAITEMTGSWSSRLVGPLGQGLINGVLTMRFGAAARLRCRTLRRRSIPWLPWRPAHYRRAASSLLRWVSEDVGPSVFGPIQRVAEWTTKTTGSTVAGGKSFFRSVGTKVKDVLGKEPTPKDPETTTGEGSSRLPGDPLLDGNLID